MGDAGDAGLRQLFGLGGEEVALGGGGSGSAAASGAYHAEDSEFGEGGSRNEEAKGVAGAVGRCDLDASIEEAEEIIRDQAFELVGVDEAEADPEAFLARTAEERFAGRLDGLIEFADEMDALDLDQGDGLALTVEGKEVGGVGLAQLGGINVASLGFAVEIDYDDLFERGIKRVARGYQRDGCPQGVSMLC